MFKTIPAAEPSPVEVEPAAEVVPLSVLQLDLGEPSTWWASHLAKRRRLPCQCGCWPPQPIAYDSPRYVVVNGRRGLNGASLMIGHIIFAV
jgi:hypothetical protein